jgi:uncharacterized integral membrane protein
MECSSTSSSFGDRTLQFSPNPLIVVAIVTLVIGNVFLLFVAAAVTLDYTLRPERMKHQLSRIE